MKHKGYWKTELAVICDKHNDWHTRQDKVVAFATRQARRQGLFRIFVLLHKLGYKTRPKNFGQRHLQALMAYWTAQQLPTQSQPKVASRIPRRDKPFSAAYIQQQISFLRAYAAWIGKPGLVKAAQVYADDPQLVKRSYCAKVDRSWAANGVDAVAMTERVRLIDQHVATQLRLMVAFGLRRKEAVMFSPGAAEVPAYALPGNHPPGERYVCFLRIKRGTKGGRLRFAAIRTEEQRSALAEATALARGKHGHVGRPGLSLKQSLDLFSNVVRQVGLTKKELGVTPHGLRHQFAGDLFFDIAHVRAPVRGGDALSDPDALQDAYRQVARQLGHNRPQISNAYLGSPRMAKRRKPVGEQSPS